MGSVTYGTINSTIPIGTKRNICLIEEFIWIILALCCRKISGGNRNLQDESFDIIIIIVDRVRRSFDAEIIVNRFGTTQSNPIVHCICWDSLPIGCSASEGVVVVVEGRQPVAAPAFLACWWRWIVRHRRRVVTDDDDDSFPPLLSEWHPKLDRSHRRVTHHRRRWYNHSQPHHHHPDLRVFANFFAWIGMTSRKDQRRCPSQFRWSHQGFDLGSSLKRRIVERPLCMVM